MAKLKKPRIPHRMIKGLEPETMHKLLNSINGRSVRDYRNKAILFVFLDTGLRLSELANLKSSDLNLEKGIIRVLGKGNKERLVRIGLKTQKALWAYLARRNSDADSIWLNSDGKHLTPDSIAQIIRDLGTKQGITIGAEGLVV